MEQVTFSKIKEAYKRIQPFINETPVLTCSTLDKLANKKIFFKCENFQKVGAFKFRGGCNSVFQLEEKSAKVRGVVTHSSGNHAQAIALAAKLRGIPAYIIMPENSPAVKIEAVKGYGATVYLCKQKDRERECHKIKKLKNAIFIDSHNSQHVVAGQGTIVLEMEKQGKFNQLDAMLTPVGGGGLLSGVSIAAKHLKKTIRVFGAEPARADDAKRSFDLKKLVKHEKTPDTCADGLLTSLGELTYGIILSQADDIFTVSEEEIKKAMKLIWERMKIIVEPSSAVPLAVVLYNKRFRKLDGIESVGIVLSGGNVDFTKIAFLK